MIETYLLARKQLKGVVLVVDARLGLTESDGQMYQFLTAHRIPLAIAATKADKLSTIERRNRQRDIKDIVGENISVILFSSHNGLGKNELWTELKNLIE